ncbi:CLUMA_CG012045, isoform A [Clunio marinus]|uniref:CLUMA_CG012045, isoform A n=1 Tax=Clunio marinus TaxID=568069 RepID=A0A1J1IFT7_9DIPT|nr:CLUMA_CG012045, isoform A [Clunio marinus]
MSEKAAQLQQYNQDLVKYIEVLKKKKMKIEIEIATDEKNKETIGNQIRLLSEKLQEIEHKQNIKKHELAKIDDTLTQSEIGYSKIIDSLQVLLNFAASKTETEIEMKRDPRH